MNEETKKKLRNAGLKEQADNIAFSKSCGEFLITLELLHETIIVHIIREGQQVISKAANTLEDVNKICYPFNGCQDLNFERKQYTWEECLDTEKGYYIDEFSTVDSATEIVIEENNKNICPTEKNAISILATTQLMQICKRINEDFPRSSEDIDKKTYYYPVSIGFDFILWIDRSAKVNQFQMNSEEAVNELIRTNKALLNQYFETEKPC